MLRLFCLLVGATSAFVVVPRTTISVSRLEQAPTTALSATSRRAWLTTTIATATTVTVFRNAGSASAGLLDDFGSDGGKITEIKKEETATAPKANPNGVQIDPSLKGSYYYPTAKKRYLPRIQKVTNEIVTVPDAILSGDWDAVAAFGKTADNAILPLQLYQSSLDGQGLSMSNSYASIMKKDAIMYEKSYKVFAKALAKTDGPAALQAVSDMGVAIADYRVQGRLRDDDGNIPSVDEMRRMAMRRPTGQY